MNEHSLKVLGYHEFLALLATYARSEPGRDRIGAMRPAAAPDAISPDRRLYADCLRLRRAELDLPAALFENPDAALVQAAPERAVLDPEGFALIRDLLVAVDSLWRFMQSEACAEAETVRALGWELDPCEDLRRRIEATFDRENGEVKDSASDRLRQLRVQMRRQERGIQSRLEALLHDTDCADAFQEDFVTTRHGRYVVPVRRELRGRVKGIVHDRSNSGSTLFVEPTELVEFGNELELLRLDEENEVRRILAELTTRLREHGDAIRDSYEALCRYDVAYAVSAWAHEYDCRPVEPGDALRLSGARHPLLQHQLTLEDRVDLLVPLDVAPPAGRTVVVITGSNTGGKTVALKTIGLLTLLAQSGLSIPAEEGSSVRFFSHVLADIGDEQSIEQSLSTFSAHLGHVVETLDIARNGEALVLLDELGAGTDPVEGGALSCAILDALSEPGGLTFATTHLGSVKQFVHEHAAMENASVLFDVQTLQPLYRLVMGRAGASYALTIAERKGIPNDLIAVARGLMNADEVRIEQMLSDLDEKQVRLEQEVREAEEARELSTAARDDVQRERDRISKELKALRKERRRLLHEAQGEAAALVARTRRQMDQILSEAKKGGKQQAGELREQLDRRQKRLAKGLEETRDRPDEPVGRKPLAVGDRVWVESIKDNATVAQIAGDRVTVDVGGLRFEVKRRDLGRPKRGASRKSNRPAVRDTVARRDAPDEIHLRRLRVEDALARLDPFLDEAMLAGHTRVRIVHGLGTGALKRAVHEHLDRIGLTRYRLGRRDEDQGGAGVTIVSL